METSIESSLDGRTAVYRLFDSRNKLLYVGITNNPKTRWLGHAGKKPWWSEVVRRDVEWVATREMAALLEAKAIQEEAPKYNIRNERPGRPEVEPRPKLHQEIAADLRQMIISGRLAPGDRVPGENTLIADRGVSRTTARQALALLREEGLTTTRHGAGVWVRAVEDRTVSIPVGRPAVAAEIIKGALSSDDLQALIALLDS